MMNAIHSLQPITISHRLAALELPVSAGMAGHYLQKRDNKRRIYRETSTMVVALSIEAESEQTYEP
jgi:hypothetical protein